MRSFTLFLTGFFIVGVSSVSHAQEQSYPVPEHVKVSMRDGVGLGTNIYLPEGEGPWPVILTRTPYNMKRYNRRAQRYFDDGFAFVTQDCRGKFTSDGVYEPYQTDMEDGYDVIEWIAEQPWSNGKVGMSGRSAMGIATNLAAAADPPHLVCGYIVTAPESLFDESYFMGGIFREHFRGNFMRITGAEDQIPILKSRVVLDEQWKRTDLIHHRHNIDIPIYNFGGWYDMFARGAINNFVALQYHGREGAKGNQKLWMGPWAHSPLDGDLDYPDAIGLNRGFDEEMRWFRYWLHGEQNGIMDEPAMTYHHLGAARQGKVSDKNRFFKTDVWPPESRDTRYYLKADKTMSLKRPTELDSATSYVFDPADPVPTAGGANYNNLKDRFPIEVGPVDQRVIASRQDYLRFETPALEVDITIQGRIEFELWAATDAVDTDFMVKLVDVYPDGYEAIMIDSPIRTRYRDGRKPGDIRMMTPGKPELMVIDLWSLSLTFEKGHKIAIHISSSSVPRFEVNPNTGEAPGESTMAARKAVNSVYHDAEHSSALILPITDLEF